VVQDCRQSCRISFIARDGRIKGGFVTIETGHQVSDWANVLGSRSRRADRHESQTKCIGSF
jgi:hypothetical protein